MTKRTVGTVVLLLSLTLAFFPIPLSNVVPAVAIALISLAYLEEDGILLLVAMLAGLSALAAATLTIWGMIASTKWIIDLW